MTTTRHLMFSVEVGAHVSVRFGEWDVETGVVYGVTRFGDIEVAFTLDRGEPGEVILIMCSPVDVEEYHA